MPVADQIREAVREEGGYRCVILCGQHHAPPEELVRGLMRRGAATLVVRDPVEVMVELARPVSHALIVDDGGATAQLQRLLAAVRRYYPQVACWSYSRGSGSHKSALQKIDPERSQVDTVKHRNAWEKDRKHKEYPELPDKAQLATDHPNGDAFESDEIHPEQNPEASLDANRFVSGLDDPKADDGGLRRVADPLVSPEELDMLMGPVSDQPWERSDEHEADAEE